MPRTLNSLTFPDLDKSTVGIALFWLVTEIARLQRDHAGNPPSESYNINEMRLALNGAAVGMVGSVANMVATSDGIPVAPIQVQLLRDTAVSILNTARDQEVAARSIPAPGHG